MVPGDLKAHSIAFIKRTRFVHLDKIDQNVPVYASIIQVINVGYAGHDFSPYELAQNYVQNCFIPLFANTKVLESLTRTIISDKDKQNFQSLMKQLSEVSTSLIRCQQNHEVPEIILNFDPEVKLRAVKARETGKDIDIAEFESLLDDSNFINNLAAGVQKWKEDIEAVRKTDFDLSSGTTLQEMNYWISRERAFSIIDQQMKFPEVKITLDILKARRRVHVTSAFENDIQSNFTKDSKATENIANFMREISISELLSASDSLSLIQAVNNIFQTLRRAPTLEGYETIRCYKLIEAVARDLKNVLVKILVDLDVLNCDYEELSTIEKNSNSVFNKFNENYGFFKTNLKKLRNDRGSYNCSFDYLPLKSRLESIFKFRKEHKELQDVINTIVQSAESQESEISFLSTKDIDDACIVFKNVDALDLTPEGENKWKNALAAYSQKIDKVETSITAKLRDQLGKANTAKDMFRIFSKFNSLLTRPRIRGAIEEYQSTLLKTVYQDIFNLKQKFLRNYVNTDAAKICATRDIVPSAGSIIWLK